MIAGLISAAVMLYVAFTTHGPHNVNRVLMAFFAGAIAAYPWG